MRATIRTAGTLILAAAFAFQAEGVLAQADDPVHDHVGHVLEGFPATPDGDGLLPVALEEARVAEQHAGFAAGDTEDLDAMRAHAEHVLHAVDPTRFEGGPGAGFGVKAAAEGIAQHIQLAATSDGASSNVTTHADHVAASARTVAQHAGAVADLATRVEEAESAGEAAPLVEEMHQLAEELITGRDATGDGEISWREGEGGLEHVEGHMELLASGEGL